MIERPDGVARGVSSVESVFMSWHREEVGGTVTGDPAGAGRIQTSVSVVCAGRARTHVPFGPMIVVICVPGGDVAIVTVQAVRIPWV